MPYPTDASLPQAVKDKIKSPKRRRQWRHVWNSEYAAHGDEGRAFATAWAVAQKLAKALVSKEAAQYVDHSVRLNERCALCSMFRAPDACTLVQGRIAPHGWCEFFERKIDDTAKIACRTRNSLEAPPTSEANSRLGRKRQHGAPVAKQARSTAEMSDNFNVFLPLVKIDKDTRTVSGYCSTPTLDLDGEIVSLDAVKRALPGYWDWRSIREMHTSSAVGVGKEAHADDKGMFLTAKIVDDTAWRKVTEGVYKGFSIGGKKLAKQGNVITEIEWIETSIVDRPANPDCRISVAKRAKTNGSIEAYLIKAPKPPQKKLTAALSKMAQVAEFLAHDGLDKSPASMPPHKDLQRTNNGDAMATLMGQACRKHGVVGCDKCAAKQARKMKKGGNKPGEGKLPYGDVTYADPGYQADKKKRYPIDTEDHIRAAWSYINKPKNAKRYSPENLASVKSRIQGAMRRIGAEVSTKSAKRKLPTFLDLRRGVPDFGLGSPSPKSPNGKTMANPVLDIKGVSKMSKKATNTAIASGDVGAVLLDVLTKAAQPTRMQRMGMAQNNMRMANRARKAARGFVEDAHKMHKNAYLSKAAQKKNDNDADDFDHAEAMEKLQKAYGELEKMGTFVKAAREQLEKVSRAGQRGQEVSDPEAGFYQVPPGVKELTQDAMSGAKPGTSGSAGVAPAYPTDMTAYPGKVAKRGKVSVEMAELMARNASLEAVNGVLSKGALGARRPYAFDTTRITAGGGTSGVDPLAKAIIDSKVDPRVLAIEDVEDPTRKAAAANVVGQYILGGGNGKPIFDPGFNGRVVGPRN